MNGAHVPRRANRENNQENEIATYQLHNTVARNAKETQMNTKFATKKFLVQVFQEYEVVFLHVKRRIFLLCGRLHIIMYSAETLINKLRCKRQPNSIYHVFIGLLKRTSY